MIKVGYESPPLYEKLQVINGVKVTQKLAQNISSKIYGDEARDMMFWIWYNDFGISKYGNLLRIVNSLPNDVNNPKWKPKGRSGVIGSVEAMFMDKEFTQYLLEVLEDSRKRMTDKEVPILEEVIRIVKEYDSKATKGFRDGFFGR